MKNSVSVEAVTDESGTDYRVKAIIAGVALTSDWTTSEARAEAAAAEIRAAHPLQAQDAAPVEPKGEPVLFGVQNIQTGVVLTTGYRDMDGAVQGARLRSSNYSVFRAVELHLAAPVPAGVQGDAARLELEELRFYKRVGFPYIDHSTMFAKDHCGYIAMTVPAHLPHPEGEGTVMAKIIRGYTVAEVYAKAKAHMAEIEGAAKPEGA